VLWFRGCAVIDYTLRRLAETKQGMSLEQKLYLACHFYFLT